MIHLDFHTGPAIPDVGKDFDAEAFAQTFADAYVDSVTLFAKCHHGHLYYDTNRPERHPGLARRLDLLGSQIEALHRKGIGAPIYISVQCDEYAANTHPEWMALDADGRQVNQGGPLGAGWQIMDMSSPYQDYFAEQLAEILDKFAPADGFFLDMCWDQPSCSKWAIDGMRRHGYDPADEADRARYAREVAHRYMTRFNGMIDRAHKGHGRVRIWYNSRPKTNLHVEKRFLRHVEIECLPTGGWGYAYFPYVARFVRPFGLPTLSHTGRFHKSWGDFNGLKPEAALCYETASILSLGITNGIGDQLHPRGKPDKATYELIGRAYKHIKDCEPWVVGGTLLSQIAVIIDPERGDHAGPDGLGVVRALQQLRHQFDLLPASADLGGYELIIVPESIRIDGVLKTKLDAVLDAGAAVLLSGDAALNEAGRPVLDRLGIAAHGLSPYSVTYLRPAKSVARGLAEIDHVMYERGFRMTPRKGATALCRVVEPYFERTYEHFCSHGQTPPDKLSRYAAVVQNGKAMTFAVPIFTAYGNHASLAYRQLLGNCIERLVPEPLIRDGGPGHLETTVVRKGRRTILHLISFYPARRTTSGNPEIIEDAFPLVDMPLSVKLERAPRRVFLAPAGADLRFQYVEGRAHTRVTTTEGHVMIVFE